MEDNFFKMHYDVLWYDKHWALLYNVGGDTTHRAGELPCIMKRDLTMAIPVLVATVSLWRNYILYPIVSLGCEG